MSATPLERVGSQTTRITTATTTSVKPASGILHRVVVEVVTVGTVTFNELVSGVTTVVMIWPLGIPVGSYELNFSFGGKIEIVTAGADRLVAGWE